MIRPDVACAALIAVVLLSGCTGQSGSATVLATSARTAGVEAVAALTAAPAPGSSATPAPGSSTAPLNWHDASGCPASVSKGMNSVAPGTVEVTELAEKSVTGVPAVPDLVAGTPPSCAFTLTLSSVTRTQLIFLDMDAGYIDLFGSRLLAAGFTFSGTGTTPQGRASTYVKGSTPVVLVYSSSRTTTVPRPYVLITQ